MRPLVHCPHWRRSKRVPTTTTRTARQASSTHAQTTTTSSCASPAQSDGTQRALVRAAVRVGRRIGTAVPGRRYPTDHALGQARETGVLGLMRPNLARLAERQQGRTWKERVSRQLPVHPLAHPLLLPLRHTELGHVLAALARRTGRAGRGQRRRGVSLAHRHRRRRRRVVRLTVHRHAVQLVLVDYHMDLDGREARDSRLKRESYNVMGIIQRNLQMKALW